MNRLVSIGLVSLGLFATSMSSGYTRSDIPDSYDDFEEIELATRLAVDGRLKLAANVLKSVDLKQPKLNLISQSNRERVLGLLAEDSAAGKSDLDRAALHFSKALQIFESAEVHFDLQRVDLARKDFSSCVASVRALRRRYAGDLEEASVSRLRTVSECFRLKAQEELAGIERYTLLSEAHSVLMAAGAKKPFLVTNVVFASERVHILNDLGFQEAAVDVAIETMKKMARSKMKGISTFALDLAGSVGFQQRVLEAAHLLSPSDEQDEILSAQAKLAYAQGKSLTSAMAFEQLAKSKSDSRSQVQLAVVELLRLSGWRSRADEMVREIVDPKDRLRARVSGYFENDETGKIAAMFPSLDRHLLDEEEWIYLGAFARLQSGGWMEDGPSAPVRWLAKLKRPDNREKATVLRQLVADCRTAPEKPCVL